MRSVLYIAWRYLAYHRMKTALLVGAVTLAIYLPWGLGVLLEQSAGQLMSRAEATPLVVGSRGSPLELVLNSLYFRSDTPEVTTYAEVGRVRESGLAAAIPLLVRFRARGYMVVGTTIDYFGFRNLKVGEGRSMATLGECVLGSAVARSLNLKPGDSLVTSPENVFDLAGVYPLKMNVVGVLETSYTPDDEAIFTDIKTTWIIQGLGHGHQDLSGPEASEAVLKREGRKVVANASVLQYNEITEENRDSFHFHGDQGGYPVTGILVVPKDQKSGVLLQGRYQADDELSQITRPRDVIEELLDTVFTVRTFVVAGLGLVAAATLVTTGLVFLLSVQLRRREFLTMARLGGSSLRVGAIVAAEIAVVLASSVLLAGLLTLFSSRLGPGLLQQFLL